jgi:hypothetical protein
MKDYQERYAERARDDHAREDAFSRLNSAPFVALLGPLAIAVVWALSFELPKGAKLGIVATAPAALLLLVLNALRLPVTALFSRRTLGVAATTIALAAATAFLGRKLGYF